MTRSSYHEQDACEMLSTDFDTGIPHKAVYEYHRDNLVWLRYVDPDKLRNALDAVFAEYNVNVIAPVHGHPIVGDDIEPYLAMFHDAVARIASKYEAGS